MKFDFSGKRITGILGVMPQVEVRFDDQAKNYPFTLAQSQKLKDLKGYDKRRIVDGSTCVSDLAIFGLNHLLNSRKIHIQDIGALLLITQSPDHFMPPTSNIVAGRIGLPNDVLCIDINQGCAGYIVGLMQACMLLDCIHGKKVVLINADALSKRVSPYDRNSHPLIGDGATITVIENSYDNSNITGELLMDGKNGDALRIPAGGFRLQSSSATSEMVTDDMGNRRSLDHLHMQGDKVFNFVMAEVPLLIRNVLATSGLLTSDISYYLMHQPNSFMLNRLAGLLDVAEEKMPSELVRRFGNSSGASIPMLIATSLHNVFINEKRKVCMAGFGAGLAWGALVMDLGKLDFVEWIDYAH